jgi:hypothetical protein
MAKGGKRNIIGSWAFLIGVVLAIILGAIGQADGTILTVLMLIGLIVGLLNITEDEVSTFLISGAVLIIAAEFGGRSLQAAPDAINGIFQALLAIFVPATIIVAIKNVFNLARD